MPCVKPPSIDGYGLLLCELKHLLIHQQVQLEKEHEQHVLNELKLKHDMNELHGRLMSVQAKADGRDRQFDGVSAICVVLKSSR